MDAAQGSSPKISSDGVFHSFRHPSTRQRTLLDVRNARLQISGSNQPTVDVTPKVPSAPRPPVFVFGKFLIPVMVGVQHDPANFRPDPFVSPAVQTPVCLRPQPPNLLRPVDHPVHTSVLVGSTTLRCPEKRSAPNRIHHHRCASGVEPATSGRCPDRRTAKDRHTRTQPPCGSCQRSLASNSRRGDPLVFLSEAFNLVVRCAQPSDLRELGQTSQISRVSNRETARVRTPSTFPTPLDTKSSPPAADGPRKGDVD